MTPELEQRIKDSIAWEAQRSAPPPGFPRLPEIPSGRYLSEEFHALEMEHIFRGSWLCVGREEDVARPGDYMLWSKIGSPILIVRGKDAKIRAFYNTCRHRGAKVGKEDCGHTNVLRCQYHSWAYDLQGKLVNIPDQDDFGDIDKSQHGLVPVACDTFGGWIFVNVSGTAGSLQDHLGALLPEWSAWKMEDLRVVHRYSRIIDCNWKAAVDAFQEVYHVKAIHPKSLGDALNHRACGIGLMPGGHSRMAVGYHDWGKQTLGVAGEGVPKISTASQITYDANLAYFCFPHIVAPMRFTTVNFQLMWPRGLNQCELELVGLGPAWGEEGKPEYWDGANERFRTVLEEDMDNLFSIQKSMESGALSGMLTSYSERKIYWIHEEIDRRIGPHRIPEGLAVKPMLAGWTEQARAAAAE